MYINICVMNFVFQFNYFEYVDFLVLINGLVDKAGWVEWGYQKVIVSLFIDLFMSFLKYRRNYFILYVNIIYIIYVIGLLLVLNYLYFVSFF